MFNTYHTRKENVTKYIATQMTVPEAYSNHSQSITRTCVCTGEQDMAKPAGGLEGTAKQNKESLENAGQQADAAAYLAANEAAAVDAYDVSIPNVDAMANGHKGALVGQAKAASVHHAAAMGGRAQAAPQRHRTALVGQAKAASVHHVAAMGGRAQAAPERRQALYVPRVQALAELVSTTRHAERKGAETMEMRAIKDAQLQQEKELELERQMWEAMGAEKEALSLAADVHAHASMEPSHESISKRVAKFAQPQPQPDSVRKDERAYQRSLRREDAIKADLKEAVQQAAMLRKQPLALQARVARVHTAKLSPEAQQLEKEAATLQAKLMRAERDLGKGKTTMQLAGDEAGGEKQTVFDEAYKTDARVRGSHNVMSDAFGSFLGDDQIKMDDIKDDVHGAVQQVSCLHVFKQIRFKPY
jgi:hypothetical protein